MYQATRTQSLTAETCDRLRADIIRGSIRPNERLVAADLAERLRISRTPVREALQLLEAEGLVVALKRGYMVREHTGTEIREIYEVRAALEGMSARLAAVRASGDAIAAIAGIGAHDDQAALTESWRLVDLNSEFHAAVVAACSNDRLGHVNRRNSEHFFNYRIAALYSEAEALAAVRGHARILAALAARDPDAAERAAREHVEEALEVTLGKTSDPRPAASADRAAG
ncbi:MAG: GntR family transcriptional regulator [Actinobacteria bacterium]|nr:GntR family transcriptional regulator [Actinomycetota bacterium]